MPRLVTLASLPKLLTHDTLRSILFIYLTDTLVWNNYKKLCKNKFQVLMNRQYHREALSVVVKPTVRFTWSHLDERSRSHRRVRA